MKILLLIGVAGFFGSLLRYGGMKLIDHWLPGFPWGTFAINVTGSFLAGFLFVLCRTKFQAFEAYFPVVFIGFLGAFTTFSTFALESSRFLLDAQYAKFCWNLVLQNAVGLPAAGFGLLLARQLFCV